MDSKEVNQLIEAFVGYREMLTPIQAEMHDFLETYNAIKKDMDSISSVYSGEIQEKLNEIYNKLSSQASKSTELTRKVDEFLHSSTKYTDQITSLISTFENIEKKISSINDINEKANTSLSKLDEVLQDKKQNYDIKELKNSMDNYTNNIKKVSDYINDEVAEKIVNNAQYLDNIKNSNDSIVKRLDEEKTTIEVLSQNYQTTNTLLKKITEKEDVNEEYIFDIIDKWAEDRKVKTKKK